MEIFGHVTKIQAISKGANVGSTLPQHTIPNDECLKQQTPMSNAEKNANNALVAQSSQNNVSNESVDTRVEVTETETSEPSNHTNDVISTSNVEFSTYCGSALAASNDTLTVPTETNSTSTMTVVSADSRRRRNPLPYTFHYVHGKNIRLCSSGAWHDEVITDVLHFACLFFSFASFHAPL